MRAVIEKDVLQAGFSGELTDVYIAAYSSVLGVTPAIVEEYMNISDGAGMSKIWFDKVFSTQGSYCLVSYESLKKCELDETCIKSNYLGAAYHNSGPMIVGSIATFQPLKPSEWGVNLVDGANYRHSPGKSTAGGKVAEILSLTPGGNKSPSLLADYFRRENKVFIFDKSINSSGIDLILELTKFCGPKCKFIVMSNFASANKRNLLDRLQMQQYLNKHKYQGTIECLQASRETASLYHDRFIFVGERFQLVLTSGLDCFGKNPQWINSDCDILVHCVYSSSEVSEFKSDSGKRFSLKSK